ncbi:aminotransferase class I/II-fold pyridoxal phosphate-dependent enzyme [Metasolibacillus meyeri]|uniref:Aminotransferase class I/II-fold pyridoxal phosphate-dependent enzyme n=1 Tax=Metasolibacillus meyeri TaxID=1071052 RepID=A0AAW9NVL4_9BACL|nr:aminotransferase class I/II-fold pyridoxal phosphate-dependent enzyme [Metasolibacillus meyeri]MEC1180612.1 aminotransferase class I/II-fold pyridoxal phosphate-dependent enzyme [Metasolibacillus meyeri]
MRYPAHGANPATLYQALQLEMPAQVIDLSENVNFLGPPASFSNVWAALFEQIAMYPHEDAEPLRGELALHHHIAKEHVVIGNGAAEILMAIAKRYTKKTVIIIEPSFSEYRRTLLQQQAIIQSVPVEELISYALPMKQLKQAMASAKAVYICNPNNPTGVVTPKHQLIELLKHGQQVGCDVVVDEAFMDWTDEAQSVIDLVASFTNLTVLRSMTKMYSMASVRLGYALTQQAADIKQELPHWNVSAAAIVLGVQALQEGDFCESSRQQARAMRVNIVNWLKARGCAVTNSETNYVAFRLPSEYDATDFYFSLLKEGIVLRHTQNFLGMDGQWFRLALKEQHKMTAFQQAMERFF